MKLLKLDKDKDLRLKSRPMAKILIIHGPNLNLLGSREPDVYGSKTLDSINKSLVQEGKKLEHQLFCFQSNSEQQLIEKIQQAPNDEIAFIIINPAAFTHYSIALRDALLAVAVPFIEVHLSNIFKREPFRHHSYFSDIALGVISGFGDRSYLLALEEAHHYLLATE
jgi:3-dehydroquinate dehydratase-2